MTKAQRIQDYVHKIATKEHISYEEAEQLAITKEFIKSLDKENNYDPRPNTNNPKCNCG